MSSLPSFRLFSLFGVDVHLSLSYFLMVVLCFFWFGPAHGIIAAFAITLSIVIHEYGHALVCKRYKLEPWIMLHGLGGLCYHHAPDTDGREALITVAGPLFQIIAGAAAFGAAMAVGTAGTVLSIVAGDVGGGALTSGLTSVLLSFLSIFAGFSIFWGLINLVLPVWPLDGGKLFVLLLRRFMHEDTARLWGLRISLFTLAPIGAVALYSKSILLIYIVFSIALENYQMLQSGQPLFAHGSGRKVKAKASPYLKEMMEKSREALANEDWREAARICHQLRASNGAIPEKTMNEIWEILGVTAVEMGEYEEALGWLKRAPQNARVKDAVARAERALVN